jgi:biopolymer transport protein TolR
MLSIPQRRAKKLDGNINIVPYIDVMLVLLIIFMMTTPIIEQGIEVDLPQSGSGEVIDFSDSYPVIISIDKVGNYYINSIDENNENKEQVELGVLTAMIKARLALNPDKQIFVRGDKEVQYNFIVELMSFLQQHNIDKVGLITESINTNNNANN